MFNATQTSYKQLEELIEHVIPQRFIKKYRNFCWNSKLNLNKTLILPELSSLYKQRMIPKLVEKSLRYITRVSNKERLTCLPSIYMGGFPKSGTTYLYNLLKNHWLISPGRVKEPHFWKFHFRGQRNYDILALYTYLANFNEGTECSVSNSDCVTIDASQSLLWDSRSFINNCDVPRLLRRFVPDAKFVILMRDPVYRMYSDFHAFSISQCRAVFPSKILSPHIFDHRMRQEIKRFQNCTRTFNMSYCAHYTLITSPPVYKKCGDIRLASSIYVTHIKRWLQYFPRKNFLFVRMEDLASNLYLTMKEIWTFIGVPVISEAQFEVLKSKVLRKPANYVPMKTETHAALKEFFAPFNHELSILLGNDKFLWKD